MANKPMPSDELLQEYKRKLHAMQSAVKYTNEAGLSADTTPKHLRVGINSAMVQLGALEELLIGKGFFTVDEYFEMIIKYLDNDIKMYADLFAQHGLNIKFG